jgi:hypothetical protein
MKRVYILVDSKLKPGQKISQACHAMALLCKETDVSANPLVVLQTDQAQLKRLRAGGVGHPYSDPYHGESRVTAMAFQPTDRDLFPEMHLA